jgi:hypothetical protein
MSQYANTFDTVLKIELALSDGPACSHNSSSYLW